MANKFFSAGNIGKAVAIVAGGAVFGQIITILLMPIVTRLYSPEAMGIQSLFVSIGNILATSAALTYPLALVLPEKESDAGHLIILSIILGTGASVAAFVFILIADLCAGFNFGELGGWTYWLPFYIFFSVLGVISSQVLVREKKFKEIARTSWELSAVTNASKVIGGLFHALPATLVVINIMSGLIRFFLSVRFSLKRIKFYFPKTGRADIAKGSRKVFVKYRDFPVYRAPQAIIAALSQSLPLVIISFIFDAGVVGQFSLALTVLSLPVNFIGSAVTQVLYPIINDAHRAGKKISHEVIRITVLMAAAGIPLFAMVGIAGGYLFKIIFGSNWILAGQFSQWLALFMFIDFISRPLIAVIPVLGRQRGLLFFEINFFTIKVLVLAAAFFASLSPNQFVAAYSLACAVIASLQIFWAVRAINSSNFSSEK
jgi:O-antigen/teichoic acid export membrane protein